MLAIAAFGIWMGVVTTDGASATLPPPAATKPGATAPAAAKPETAKPATTKPAAPGKLAPATAKEMADAIVAVNKALGLESWPQHGVKPCIDRGGQGILAKDVTPDDTRKCATAALEKGFPELGKTYGLAVLMGGIGPYTVIALGAGDAAGWGAYSCDPTRACKAMKINPANKWGKRLEERRSKACAEATTIWLPARACESK